MVDLPFWRFADNATDHNAKSLFDSAQPQTSTQINLKMEDTQVKKTFVICLALLVLASLTALAQDSIPGTITINGGSQAVYVGPAHKITPGRRPAVTIYSNFNSNTATLYTSNTGWAISDGSTLGEEFTQGNSFVSPKTATVHSIRAALSLAGGTGENYVALVKDCAGEPCHVDFTKNQTMCRALAKVSQPFGQCCATVRIKCASKVKKGKTYWIVMESKTTDNTFTVWNWSNAPNANGYDSYSLNDAAWASNGNGNPQGAFSIQ